jgi:hypothetical protein
MKHLFFNTILFLQALATIAQTTTITLPLAKTNVNGLHAIALPTTFRAYAKPDVSNVRLLDSKQTEEPYAIALQNTKNISNYNYTILNTTVITNKYTELIISNATASKLTMFYLNVANTDANKQYNLSGSNDTKQWFGLVNNGTLTNLSNTQALNASTAINFPTCNYKYFKLQINDSNSLPIHVLSVSNTVSTTENIPNQKLTISSIKTTNSKESKTTTIALNFGLAQVINQLAIRVTKPSAYKRMARVYTTHTQVVKHNTQTYTQTISEIELIANTSNTFTLPETFAKDLFIEIQNLDSPPLTISNIEAYQQLVTLVADLQTSETYTLTTGNAALLGPNYDLSFFNPNINLTTLPKVTYQTLKTTTIITPTKPKSFWQNSWFMWACISISGLVIAYFARGLIKDIKQ